MTKTLKSKVCAVFSLCYVLFMATVSFVYFAAGNPRYPIAIGGIVCGAIPFLLDRFAKVRFNYLIITSYFAFLFAAQFLGSMRGFYSRISWWDILLHCISGILAASISLDLLERLTDKKTREGMKPWFMFIYVLSFAVFVGVIWEIYEFSIDQWFGTRMQVDNVDTMTDLIADTAGGVIVAIIAVLFQVKIRKGLNPLFKS